MNRYKRTPIIPQDLLTAQRLFSEGNFSELTTFASKNVNLLHLLALNKRHAIIKAVEDVYIANAHTLDVNIFERLYFSDQPHKEIIKAVAPHNPEVAFKIFARLVFPHKFPCGYFESVSNTPDPDPQMEEFLRPYLVDRLPFLIEGCGGAVCGVVPLHQDWNEDMWDTIRELDLQAAQKAVTLCPYTTQSYNFELGLQKAVLYADYVSINILFSVSTHSFLTQSFEEWVNKIGHVRWDDDFFNPTQDVKDAWVYAQSLCQKNRIGAEVGKTFNEKRRKL